MKEERPPERLNRELPWPTPGRPRSCCETNNKSHMLKTTEMHLKHFLRKQEAAYFRNKGIYNLRCSTELPIATLECKGLMSIEARNDIMSWLKQERLHPMRTGSVHEHRQRRGEGKHTHGTSVDIKRTIANTME